VNALADDRVGAFVNTHFVSAYKKVGTFRKNGNAKNGGNVATYFCLPDETVIHVVPGPVTAAAFLREARWAMDVYESANLEFPADLKEQREYVREAHMIRYLEEHGKGTGGTRSGVPRSLRARMPRALPQGGKVLAQAHWLLWSEPMPRLAAIYGTVWTDILKEELSDRPVIEQ
jgi:hypothetical protein